MTVICIVIFWVFMALRPAHVADDDTFYLGTSGSKMWLYSGKCKGDRMSTRAFVIGIATLFLATGTAHAQSNYTGRSIFGSNNQTPPAPRAPSEPLRRRYSAPIRIDHLR